MAKISTDKSDYAPGETATITLTDFDPGMLFNFNIQEWCTDPGDDGIANTYTLVPVTDGGEGDLDGVENGQIVTSWIVEQSALNATLDLTATGAGTDRILGTADDVTATTKFTDALNPSASTDQWANGSANSILLTDDEWLNGIVNESKAHYNEGDFLPYRARLEQLTNNQEYWYTFSWDTTKSDKHALDYIGTWDESFTTLPLGDKYPDLFLPAGPKNVNAPGATTDTFEIAIDRQVAGASVTQIPGDLTLVNGEIEAYVLAGPDNTFGGVDDRLIRPGADNEFGTTDDSLQIGPSGVIYTVASGQGIFAGPMGPMGPVMTSRSGAVFHRQCLVSPM